MGYLNDELLTAPADALVIPMTDDFSQAIEFSTGLRALGIRTQIYCEQKKFKAKISYADKLKIPYAAFLGEDEIAKNAVTVKNLRTGEQETLPYGAAAEKIRSGVGALSRGTVIKPKD